MSRRTLLAAVSGCVVTLALADGSNSTRLDHRTTVDDRSEEPRLGVITNSYYDFLINEGSYKFWAIFQLVTVAILLYSTFAAVYYAKYTFLQEVNNSDVDDFFLRRRSAPTSARRLFLGLDPRTFQRIMDSVSDI